MRCTTTAPNNREFKSGLERGRHQRTGARPRTLYASVHSCPHQGDPGEIQEYGAERNCRDASPEPFLERISPALELEQITREAINFDTPLVQVEEGLYALELFHGPTLAFKDVGARFLARLLGYYTRDMDEEIHVLVATSGDTGSAVANGFLGVEGIRVHVLYPSGGVTPLQEKQFTTLGNNITALEVDGKL